MKDECSKYSFVAAILTFKVSIIFIYDCLSFFYPDAFDFHWNIASLEEHQNITVPTYKREKKWRKRNHKIIVFFERKKHILAGLSDMSMYICLELYVSMIHWSDVCLAEVRRKELF